MGVAIVPSGYLGRGTVQGFLRPVHPMWAITEVCLALAKLLVYQSWQGENRFFYRSGSRAAMRVTEIRDTFGEMPGMLRAEQYRCVCIAGWRVTEFRWLTAALLLVTLSMAMAGCSSSAAEVRVMIKDDSENHVHPPDRSFSLQLKIEEAPPSSVRFHWRDFRGRPLTKPEPLASNKLTAITSPVGHAGYLGLVLEPTSAGLALPNRNPGEKREYGFALLPLRPDIQRPVDKDSGFGVVHADLEDPYLSGWVKTMTWKTTSPEWWGFEMERRRERSLVELPIVVGAEWASADTQPVSSQQLKRLSSRVRKYFEAHPVTGYWELGIEENLRRRYETPYYWSNLEAKTRAVREAANEVNPDIKLVYQVAELRPRHVEAFLESATARHFDILSLHPYAWPDFPDPEQWLDDYLKEVDELMAGQGRVMPVWFTEVGVPHHGNAPGAFFGYPKKGAEVMGKSRYEAASYLVKLYVLAFHHGVEKVFWYNYKDRAPGREYAENHFGLYDYWGYPKPVYLAYINLIRQLHGKKTGDSRQLPDNVRVYEFTGEGRRLAVVWTHPAVNREVQVSSLFPGHAPGDLIEAVDPMGGPVTVKGASIPISGEPVFIQARLKQQDKDHITRSHEYEYKSGFSSLSRSGGYQQ